MQALPPPEEECAAADARLAEGFAEGLAEPQVDDHSVPAEESNEWVRADHWAAPRVADSGPPPAYSVALQVAGWEELLPGDCWVAPQVVDWESPPACWVAPWVADCWAEWVQVDCSVVPQADDRCARVVRQVDWELLPDDYWAELVVDGYSAVPALADLVPPDAHSQLPAEFPVGSLGKQMQVVPVARNLLDDRWSESQAFPAAPALPSDGTPRYWLGAGSALHASLTVVQDVRPALAAVWQKALVAEAAFSWQRLAGSQLPRGAQSRAQRSKLSTQERFRALEPPQLSHSPVPMRSVVDLLALSLSLPAARW